jgi:murein DD-endopeptidase MepM/ murein hydrolase activator NlpD
MIVSLVVAVLLVGSGMYVLENSGFRPVQTKICKLLDWQMDAYAVMIDNQEVAVVEAEDTVASAWNQAVAILNSGDVQYHIFDAYQLVQTTAKPSEFVDEASLEQPFEEYLEQNLSNYTIVGYTLQLGDLSFVFQTQEEIYQLFCRLAENCLGDGYQVACEEIEEGQPVYQIQETEAEISVQSAEAESDVETELLGLELPYDITYQMIYTRSEDMTSVDEAFEACVAESVVEKEYTVESGDSLIYIAKKNDLTMDELLALNPGLTVDSTIMAGDVFCVQASEPKIAVYQVVREVYDRYDDPPIEYVYDDTKYTNYYEVLDEGKQALVRVEDVVTYNGTNEVSREQVEAETLEEAKVKKIRVGTMALPQFIWPTHGVITTEYGLTWDEVRSGVMHYGLDIANSSGTYIYASAGGEVIRAGWYSSYGYCVMIDHHNGFVTLYGHCRSIDVSVGQWVNQGDLIARMGTTGWSSGNHCHFEIIYNGTCINPRRYLN